MKILSKILEVLAWGLMIIGVINLWFVILVSSVTWSDNGWRIVITLLVAFGIVYAAGVLRAIAERKQEVTHD